MKIEVAVNKNSTTKEKGDLLEEMARSFLEVKGFSVTPEVKNTGAEIDLLCRGKANHSKEIFVECKAYNDDKKIDAEVIVKLVGIRDVKKYQEAWLVSTSQFTKDAKGIVDEIENGENANLFTFYTPDKLVTAFVDAKLICDFEVARQKIIDLIKNENKIRDCFLLITKYGYFWAFEYLQGGKPRGAIVTHAKNGDIVKEKDLLSDLQKLESGIKDLDFLQLYSLSNVVTDDSILSVSDIKLNSDYMNEISETGIKSPDSENENLSLDDIFVFPHLESLSDNNDIIKSDVIYQVVPCKMERYLLLGRDLSGKTTLAKMVQKKVKSKGGIPLYIRAEQIKHPQFEKFNNLLLSIFKKQYDGSSAYVKLFESLIKGDRSKFYLIIDDFDSAGIKNSLSRISFLKMLTENFSNILIFSDKSIEVEIMASSEVKEAFNSFSVYWIKQLGHLLRDELIEKWLMIGGGCSLSNADLLSRKEEIAGKINLAVGTNFIPTYPPYLLTILQLVGTGGKLELQGSSYAELYNYLINQFLRSANAKPEDLDFYHTYLSFMAHYFLNNNLRSMSKQEMQDMYKKYCEEMDIGKNFKSTHDLLVRAKILTCEGDVFAFNHKYCFYYFTAKYLSDNIFNKVILAEVEQILEKIHKSEHANILMFFIHHSKNCDIIDKILKKASLIFEKVVPHTLTIADMEMINSLIHEELKLVVDSRSASEIRKESLAKRDKINDGISKKSSDDKEEEKDQSSIFGQVNLAVKLIEILGQIAKSYYGSIDAEKKRVILDEVCSLGLRSLRSFLEGFRGYLEGIKDEIGDLLEKTKKVNSAEKADVVNKIIYRFQEMIIFMFIKNISYGLSSSNLFVSTDKIAKRNDNPAGKIISLAVRMNFPNELDQEKILALDKEFDGNYIAKRLLRILVIDHMYKFEVDHAMKQRICQKLGMAIQQKIIGR
jgi:Holliday junction resolvase-like predicted endonuclease